MASSAGNGFNDQVILGGAGAKATMGFGGGDLAEVGVSFMGTSEIAGSALGDKVTFGNAATAQLLVGAGAEVGSTAGTNSIGLTKVVNAADGMQIDFSAITTSSTIVGCPSWWGPAESHDDRECRSRGVGRPRCSFLHPRR